MTRAAWLALVLTLFAAGSASAAELKVATWNLNWLSSRQAGLPADVKLRAPEDFERLSDYARTLNADIIAIQEVENAETARRLFPPETYSIHMSRDRVRQRVGIVVRRGISYTVNPDVTEIALDPAAHLRSGVDITLQAPFGPLRLLAVHLKQGCQYFTPGRAVNATCDTLMAQFDVVSKWIAKRHDEATPFLVLGDFNRGLERRDAFVDRLMSAEPLARADEGYSSPCWNAHEPFIDHILSGGPARDWTKPNSFRVLTYQETEPAWKDRLSDHCPVSVRLTVPD